MTDAAPRISLAFNDLPLDRLADRRKDEPWIKALIADPNSRLLTVHEGDRVPVDASGALAWRAVTEIDAGRELVFLGVDDDGRALFSCDDALGAQGVTVSPLREVGTGLSPIEAAAALQAVAISTWHRRHPRCAVCGAETVPIEAGHVRHCAQCETDHFPRMDPAVIMLVTNGERCVLGRRQGSPQGRWSTLAGYIDPGESAEAAVVREVFEEAGLTVREVRYRGSQPWPFPASLMMAFEASADDGEIVVSEEHHEVRWFERRELAEGIAGGSLTIAGPVSAGNFLIRSWLV